MKAARTTRPHACGMTVSSRWKRPAKSWARLCESLARTWILRVARLVMGFLGLRMGNSGRFEWSSALAERLEWTEVSGRVAVGIWI